jgi:hypothetical protein
MKKLIMSILLTVAISYGFAFAQSSSTQSTQTQDKNNSKQSSAVMSDQAGWQKIGETTIDLKKGKDELALNTPEKFKAIRVKTENTAVDFTDLQLYYDTGDKQDVSMDIPLKANSESQVIKLNETNHLLKKIVFACKTSNNMTSSGQMKNSKDMKSDEKMEGSAKVEVWGLRSDTAMK